MIEVYADRVRRDEAIALVKLVALGFSEYEDGKHISSEPLKDGLLRWVGSHSKGLPSLSRSGSALRRGSARSTKGTNPRNRFLTPTPSKR